MRTPFSGAAAGVRREEVGTIRRRHRRV